MDFDKLKKVAKGAVAAASAAATVAAAVGHADNISGSKKKDESKLLSGYNVKVLNDTFDVSEIKHYYLANVKFLYVPEFVEKEVEGLFNKKKVIIDFAGKYSPFAGIIETGSFEIDASNSALKNTKDKIIESAISTVGKTIGEVADVIGEKINTYRCIDKNGKVMYIKGGNIPCNVTKLDGTIIEVKSEDVSDEIEPKIIMVPALIIEADKKYYYFGNGINFEEIDKEFERLDNEIKSYKNSSLEENVQEDDVDKRLKKIKQLLDQKLISEEEYHKKVDDILKDL